MTKIKPLRDHVVIEAIKEEVKKGGIIIPDTVHKERPEQGKVVATGPGKIIDGKLQPVAVKRGDIVLFGKYGPNQIKIDDKEYLIAKEEEILAIIEL